MSRSPDRWLRIAAGFLAVSYAIGAPFVAVVEFREHTFSARFGYAPAFMYLISLIQIACVGGVFMRRFAPWAAAALSAITLGAIYAHLRIGSPVTSIPAVGYTVVQVWFGMASRAPRR